MVLKGIVCYVRDTKSESEIALLVLQGISCMYVYAVAELV